MKPIKVFFFTIDKIVPFFYSLADGETPLIEDEEEDALLESQEFEEKVSILILNPNKAKLEGDAQNLPLHYVPEWKFWLGFC